MDCEYSLCIYYDNSKCTLDEIRINSLGMCDNCIDVQFTEEELSQRRAYSVKKNADKNPRPADKQI